MPTDMPAGRRLAVISPHLDDAVLGCAELIAANPGATVVTVFAGRPPGNPELTSWDARAGFAAGDDVAAARRDEDRAALRELGAHPVWLDFPDTQYGETPTVEAVAKALDGALDQIRPDAVAIPLGLFHSDHRLTSDAAVWVMQSRPGSRWLAYADAIYRRVPELLDERLGSLAERGVEPVSAGQSGGPASELKRRAAACYTSQLRALAVSWDGGHADAFEPEDYWTLAVGASVGSAHRPGGMRDDR